MPDIQSMFNLSLDIFSLLPCSPETVLISKQQKTKELHLLKLLVHFSLLALDAFVNEDLTKFDAQVGENLCQIRAYKNVLLAKKWLISLSQKSKLKKMIDAFKTYQVNLNHKIEEWDRICKDSFHYDKKLDAHENIKSFLDRLGIYYEINEDILYLIICYILNYFSICENGVIIAINFNIVSEELNISKYLSKKIIKKFQVTICKIGSKFISEIAREISFKNEYSIIKHLYQSSDESRLVLPCLLVTEVIMFHCIYEKIPIFICCYVNTNQMVYFLLKGDGNIALKLIDISTQMVTKYCLVFLGETQHIELKNINNFITNFLKLNPLKIILANAASHPQYSGKKLEYLRDNPYSELNTLNNKDMYIEKHWNRLEELKEYAKITGCSKNNKNTYYIKHIYASNTLTEINRLYSIVDFKIHDASMLNKEICQEA